MQHNTRALLLVLGTSLSLVAFSGTRGRPAAVPSTASGLPSTDTWKSPSPLLNSTGTPGVVELDLTAAPTRLELVPGKPTEAWAYNGMVPGPTIELREGDQVTIHFHNQLKQPTTVHWHGLHLPAGADGSPLYPVLPGQSRDYVFRVPLDSAGTYWYHPHPDMTTTEQVSRGLYGGLIVRAANDPLAGIPERLMILSDNRFKQDGSVDLPDHMSQEGHTDQENGREGDTLFVNGHAKQTVSIKPGELQRWRIVNASPARVYRLALPNQKMLHVGSDGGLFEKPLEASEILLANSERVEVLVRGGAPGARTTLQTLPYDRYDPHTRPADWEQTRDVVEVQTTTDAPVTPPAVPAALRRIAPISTKFAAARRVIVFSQGLINGKPMDMKRVDVFSRLGSTEIWKIENVVTMDHPFHLHGFRFQVLDRDGVPEPYLSWKDSVNVPKHSAVRIAVKFDDFPGKWMFHCHILDHEDMGMMGILQVR
jgi:bilirubin oxidase